jgi:hypothetical protein
MVDAHCRILELGGKVWGGGKAGKAQRDGWGGAGWVGQESAGTSGEAGRFFGPAEKSRNAVVSAERNCSGLYYWSIRGKTSEAVVIQLHKTKAVILY